MFYERNDAGIDPLSLKVLLVDPDSVSRQNLITLLSKDPSIKSIEECSHGIEAVAAIRDLRPDILISEVELPGMHGFALMDSLPQANQPATIFISGRDQYAARAFDVSAVDYLLKPVVEQRFIRALDRAKRSLQRTRSKQMDGKTRRQLAIKTGRCVFFVKADELDWAEAEGKYVRLHMGAEVLLLKMSISALEAELDPEKFVRIHRCTIVNTDRVRWVQPWNHGRNYQIILQDGTKLILSRKEKLRKLTGHSFSSPVQQVSTF
jgi:two-component system, LytTR family, response regulator